MIRNIDLCSGRKKPAEGAKKQAEKGILTVRPPEHKHLVQEVRQALVEERGKKPR